MDWKAFEERYRRAAAVPGPYLGRGNTGSSGRGEPRLGLVRSWEKVQTHRDPVHHSFPPRGSHLDDVGVAVPGGGTGTGFLPSAKTGGELLTPEWNPPLLGDHLPRTHIHRVDDLNVIKHSHDAPYHHLLLIDHSHDHLHTGETYDDDVFDHEHTHTHTYVFHRSDLFPTYDNVIAAHNTTSLGFSYDYESDTLDHEHYDISPTTDHHDYNGTIHQHFKGLF